VRIVLLDIGMSVFKCPLVYPHNLIWQDLNQGAVEKKREGTSSPLHLQVGPHHTLSPISSLSEVLASWEVATWSYHPSLCHQNLNCWPHLSPRTAVASSWLPSARIQRSRAGGKHTWWVLVALWREITSGNTEQ
jgi:hypothetical protein